jgi:membrane protease YdiL (CAAX protease family)
MARWGRFAAVYAGMALFATLLAIALRGAPPFSMPAWLPLSPPSDVLYSLGLGTCLGLLVAVGTRFCVPRFAWAKNLHRELRPLTRGLSGFGIVGLAATSALGEELLFRGLLQPWLGLWLQALLFGVLHQLTGPSRWVWAGWATLVGLALGAIFALTGSVAGPFAAHALINGLNLSYLRSHDTEPPPGLGGLLGSRG